MQPEKTIKEEITKVINDLQVAMLNKVEAERKYEEASAEMKKAHYEVVKSRQRLDMLYY